MNKSLFFLAVCLLAMLKVPSGCGGGKARHHAHKPAETGTNAPAGSARAPSQSSEGGPTVRITSPLRNEEVRSSDIAVFVKVQDLPPNKGAHVHVIVDDQPAEELTDPQLPIVSGQLGPGLHVVRAFACNGDHVSFKNPSAFAMTSFRIAGTGSATSFDLELPTLTFNLPGPRYGRSEAKKLPLDFFVTCPTGADVRGWRVRVSVNGEQKLLLDATSCAGATLPPLGKGDHSVRLELLDAGGRLIKANFAWSERTVRIR